MMVQYVSLLAFYLFLCFRILFRAFCNTVCPSDLVRAQKMERLSAQDYSSSLRQWRESTAAQRHVPQNLSVNADMPYLTDCIAEQGAVLSWPITKSLLVIYTWSLAQIVTVYSCTLMIGRYSDQSEFRAGFSLASESVFTVMCLGSLTLCGWSLQMNCIANSFLSSDHRMDLESGFCEQKKSRIVYISHGWACDVFIHTCTPASHKNLKSCEDEMWVRMWLLCSYSNAILHFWLLRLQYSEFHNCIGHLKISLLLSLTRTYA